MSRATDALSRQNLLRLGFQDTGHAQEQLAGLGDPGEPLLAILGRTAGSSCAPWPTTRAPRCAP